nr:uncharacterized protein LOC108018422 [Drosophila suzukii]
MLFILFVCLVVIPEALFLTPKSYEVTLLSLTWAENSWPYDFKNIRLIGREHLVNGTFTILEDLNDENCVFSTEIYHNPARDGNFKLMPYSMPAMGVCTFFNDYGYYFTDSIKKENTDLFINKTDCVFPKGTHFLKNIAISTDNWPPILARGNIRHVASIFKNGVLSGTYNITSSIDDRVLKF